MAISRIGWSGWVVGIGASAGGLIALRGFLAMVPGHSGLAFVVIAHSHPGHVSLLPELLASHAAMPVVEVTDGMSLAPDRVHVAPPGTRLSLRAGALHLHPPAEPRSEGMAIDHFFQSLARDRGSRAIGVVLSGTGSDGTLGAEAIKAEGGVTLAQDPGDADYAGMPISAIGAGSIDHVLPAAEQWATIAAHVAGWSEGDAPSQASTVQAIERVLPHIVAIIRDGTGQDFRHYKTSTVVRRIERRMLEHRLNDPGAYIRLLQDDSAETAVLFKALLIGVTSFFRDPDAYAALLDAGVSALIAAKPHDGQVRVWVPGCATGEEAYSLAIIIREEMIRQGKSLDVQIFATDLDSQSIEFARRAVYSAEIGAEVSAERLARCFASENGSYQMRRDLREMVVFAEQNVLTDPPFSRMDLVSCRNLLIYLETPAQSRVLALFHHALQPEGLLWLGTSESLGGAESLFTAEDEHWRVYRRADVASPRVVMGYPERGRATRGPGDAVGTRAQHQQHQANVFEQVLRERFVPATVFVTERGNISHIHGKTGRYLEPAPGQPSLNVLLMAREGLKLVLAGALRQAAKEQAAVTRQAVEIDTDGDAALVDLTVAPVTQPKSLSGLFMIAFAPATRLPAPEPVDGADPERRRIAQLETELGDAKETLDATITELETSSEELTSANEELQSTNEELQSANEELETSKEEMQSLNEELQTVNAELQAKIMNLSRVNDDMTNLLDATDVATIFLDTELKIARYTPTATRVVHLIPGDVGRPLADLAPQFDAQSLVEDAAAVLRTLQLQECELRGKDGHFYQTKILPYRTVDNAIEGLVLTFSDVTMIRRALEATETERRYAESIVATIREPLVVLDAELRVVSANSAFYRRFSLRPAETEHALVYELGERRWDIPELRRLLEDLLPEGGEFNDFVVEGVVTAEGPRRMLLNARRVTRSAGVKRQILLAFEDASDGH